MSSITVLITSYNDKRIVSTLDSLMKQTIKPREILVADGGTKWDIREICNKYGAIYRLFPGNVVQTRNEAIKIIESEIIAFIDTDEVATPAWLENLTKPIIDGFADFSGGPTKHHEPQSEPERYLNLLEDDLYNNLVTESITYLPMGNSAWKKEVFEKLGGFDLSISGGGEDYDLNLRAIKSGYKGVFVEGAAVFHDHSEVSSYRKLAMKRYSYLRATAKTYLKNGVLSIGMKGVSRVRVKHPFYLVETIMKPIALIDAMTRK